MKLRIYSPGPGGEQKRVDVDKACCDPMMKGLTQNLLIPFGRQGEPPMLAFISHVPNSEQGHPLRFVFCPWCAEEITVEAALYTPPTTLHIPPDRLN